MRTLLFASCAVLLLLAGCAGTTTTTSGTTTSPVGAAGAVKPEVLQDKGTITVSAGVGVTYTVGAAGVAPNVGANVTLMYVELKWAGPTDLDLCVNKPSSGNTAGATNCEDVGNGGQPGMPDSPFHATFAAPETGEWSVSPYANAGTAETEYDLAVTLFYGEREVPAGYTAFA